MELSEFWTICSANGIILSQNQLRQFTRYGTELIKWNSKVNLISRKDEDNVVIRHLLHSLSILKYVQIPKKSSCLDIGTGGGLPGIPIAIANPDIKMLLVDSIAKKMKITEILAKHTEHRHIRAQCIRAEDLEKNIKNRKQYDFIFARAVKKISVIYPWIRNVLKDTGKIVMLKGGNLKNEIKEAEKMFHDITVREIPISIVGVDWFEKEEKKILICEKINKPATSKRGKK